MINLLEGNDLKCKLGTLNVLRVLSQTEELRRCMTNLGGVDLLIRNLSEPARDLQILVAETIANVAQIKKARKHVRRFGGIPKLVDFLDVNESYLQTELSRMNSDELEIVSLVTAAARALQSCSSSRKNIRIMMKSGCVPLLARLLRYQLLLK